MPAWNQSQIKTGQMDLCFAYRQQTVEAQQWVRSSLEAGFHASLDAVQPLSLKEPALRVWNAVAGRIRNVNLRLWNAFMLLHKISESWVEDITSSLALNLRVGQLLFVGI